MKFITQKSKIAIFILSIINFQIICMESDGGGDFRLHRADSISSINEPEFKVKKKCSKYKACMAITSGLNIALIIVLLVALYKVYDLGKDLNAQADKYAPVISKAENFFDNTEPECQTILKKCIQWCIPKK